VQTACSTSSLSLSLSLSLSFSLSLSRSDQKLSVLDRLLDTVHISATALYAERYVETPNHKLLY